MTSNILKSILKDKRAYVDYIKQQTSFNDIKIKADDSPPARGFAYQLIKTIQTGDPAVIAEIKKASPSQGVIKPHFEADIIAKSYADAGATCLSVLTDIPHFMGSDEDLKKARMVCKLPILRKDFIIDPYQIYETKVIGADCVLIIVAALSDMQMQDLVGIANEIELDVLVEIHNREELERGLVLRTPLIGINNRNLHNFKTDLKTTLGLLPDVFHDRTVITESGISTKADVSLMRKNNVNAFLVGEALMKSDNPGHALKNLFKS